MVQEIWHFERNHLQTSLRKRVDPCKVETPLRTDQGRSDSDSESPRDAEAYNPDVPKGARPRFHLSQIKEKEAELEAMLELYQLMFAGCSCRALAII